MKNFNFLILCALAQISTAQTVHVEPFGTTIFSWLVGFERAPGDDRLFVLQKNGYVVTVNPDGQSAGYFLNISNKVNNAFDNEQGLVGAAFHPNFASNGYLFVFYNQIGTGDCKIVRFKRSNNNPNVIDLASETLLLSFPHPGANHVGGCMKFGKDGYLYVGAGDGGGAGDPNGNGQNRGVFLGKILRLDVDVPAGSSVNYEIPPDNPFVNVPGALPEIFAYGLRNPWRMSFDRLTGDLWIADVGQDLREEVNFIPAGSPGGQNFGWSCKEGTLDFNAGQCDSSASYVPPLFEYDHENTGTWCTGSVSGGVVYRGGEWADLFGKYVFTDFCTGKIWALSKSGDVVEVAEAGNFTDIDYTMLDENERGELLLAGFYGNRLWKVKSDDCTPVALVGGSDTLFLSPGGSLSLSAVPGVAGINYQWLRDGNPILNGSAATLTVTETGTYEVVVTNPAENCAAVSNAVLVLPGSGNLSVAGQVEVCQTESFEYAVPQIPGAIYAWSATGAGSISGMGTSKIQVVWGDFQTGSVSVQVTTPGGETLQATLGVTIHEHDLAMEILAQPVTCFGGSDGEIQATVGGSGNLAWQWSNGDTALHLSQIPTGMYVLNLANDWGCTLEGTANVLQPSELQAQMQVVNQPTFGNGDGSLEASASGGTPPYDVLWSNGATSFLLENLPAGAYSVTFTDAHGCQDSTSLALEELPSAAGEARQPLRFSLFPNPATDFATLVFTLPASAKLGVEAVDLLGREIQTVLPFGELAAGEHSIKFATNDWHSGVWFLKLRMGEHEIHFLTALAR